MPEKPIGVALIGCGNIGQIHATTFAHLAADGVLIRPVMAADPVAENRENAASDWPFERLVADAKEVFGNPEVDAVFICTPTPLTAIWFLPRWPRVRTFIKRSHLRPRLKP